MSGDDARGTDARFVYDMSDRVYRFSTIYAKGDHHVHAVDEFTGVEELADSIDFYGTADQIWGDSEIRKSVCR